MRQYLGKVIQPLVSANGRLYSWINGKTERMLRRLTPRNGSRLKISANEITTSRSMLVVPTVFMFSNGYTFAPAALVIANVTLDYVDGVVARWEQDGMRRLSTNANEAYKKPKMLIPSSASARLEKTWGAYYDAIADKAFAIPVWMCVFQNFSEAPLVQAGLLSHVFVEMYSSYVRTRSFFREPSSTRWIEGLNHVVQPGLETKQSEFSGDTKRKSFFPSSRVVAGMTGKTKQMASMVGTALLMIPATSPLGAVLIWVSLPMAIASVLQKNSKSTVYAELRAGQPLSRGIFDYLERSKELGSKLILGVRHSDDGNANGQKTKAYEEYIQMMRLHPSVDFVLHGEALPNNPVASKSFRSEHGIDIVALRKSELWRMSNIASDACKSGLLVPIDDITDNYSEIGNDPKPF